MWRFKKLMLQHSDSESGGITGYCIDWQAFNDGDIKMSLEGIIDFTTILNSTTPDRFIDTVASSGTVTSYIIDGVTVPCSIPMTFSSKKAFFNDDGLTVVTGEVLTVITFTVLILCTNADEIDLVDLTLSAIETPTQTEASYSGCF